MTVVDRGSEAALSDADWFATAPPIADPLMDSSTRSTVALWAAARAPRREMIVKVPAAERTTFLTALEQIQHLVTLAPNWDSYGAATIGWQAAERTIRLIEAVLRNGIAAPAIVPTSSGGIQLEWHRGESVVELEVDRGGKTDFFIATPNGEAEGPLVDVSRLGDLLDMIGR